MWPFKRKNTTVESPDTIELMEEVSVRYRIVPIRCDLMGWMEYHLQEKKAGSNKWVNLFHAPYRDMVEQELKNTIYAETIEYDDDGMPLDSQPDSRSIDFHYDGGSISPQFKTGVLGATIRPNFSTTAISAGVISIM